MRLDDSRPTVPFVAAKGPELARSLAGAGWSAVRKFSGLRAGEGFGPRGVIVHDVILHFRHVRKAKLAERALMDDISPGFQS